MSMPVDELKNRLKEALSIRQMRPFELSEKTNIPKSSISQYMSGYTKPNNERIYTIAKTLDINEAWLMGFDSPMERNSLNFKTMNSLSHEEKTLLNNFRKLNTDGKAKAAEYVSDLTTVEKYTAEHEYTSTISPTAKLIAYGGKNIAPTSKTPKGTF